MRLLSLYFILFLAVPSLCSTVATVLADLAVVQNNLNSLNSAITAFPPYIESINFSTASQLLAAISAATVLVAALHKGATDTEALNPSPVNDTDGRVLVDRIKALEPSIVDTRVKLLQRKGVVAVLPAIPLVGNPLAMARATIASVQAALNLLEDAALKAAPANLRAEGVALRGRIDNNMNAVLAAYSS